MKRSTFLLATLLVAQAWMAQSSIAGQIDAQILQFKLDRFYFNVGKEALVFPGHHFAILRGKDTVVSGVIEESYEGVSIGRGTLPKDGRRNFEKYKASVETAEAEPITHIRIGAYSGEFHVSDSLQPLPASVMDSINEAKGVLGFTSGEDTILVEPYDDTLLLFDKLDRQAIDAVVYPGSSGPRPNYHVQSARAPFIAVLLPNLTRQVTQDGMLATSLFYRFDPARIQSSLTQPCDAVASFQFSDSLPGRFYPFDQAKGKELFRQMGFKPEQIRIMTEESLRPIAAYFADVLAREQCKTEIVSDSSRISSCDFLLTYVACIQTGSKEIGYDGATNVLNIEPKRLNMPGPGALQRLNEIRIEADTTNDIAARDRLYAQADQLLIHELGCLPLFRPMYTLVTRKEIAGIRLDARGQVSISHLKRVLLPEPAEKEPR